MLERWSAKPSNFYQIKMDKTLQTIKKLIPKKLFEKLSPLYHYSLSLLGALIYHSPSSELTVIAVTGTKGKSSTTEMLNAIFEASGKKTILLNTIRFKIGDKSKPNKLKMTVPGRFFLQKHLRDGIKAGCDTAIIELSSEAAKQYRHKFIDLDALIFTNISPEHIESHGSFEKYKLAKLSLAESLGKNKKERSILVVNSDDPEAKSFLECKAKEKIKFSLKDAEPWEVKESGVNLTFKGVRIHSELRGEFNIRNMLGAAFCAEAFGIDKQFIKKGLEELSVIKGRVEFVKTDAKQDFDVVVDYAHTADSLKELYTAFKYRKKICVLGNTGGGRDRWKRPEMAKVADNFCDTIFLTNEDPYDEDPKQIIDEMLPGFSKKEPIIVMDRREAIREAIKSAQSGDVVLITGKGTDPYIMLENGKKLPWSDVDVAKEELEKVLNQNARTT